MAEKQATLPKFNFSGCSIKDDVKLQEELEKSGGQDKFFKEGLHDVEIKTAVFEGMQPKDPTWGKLKVTFLGTNEKEINAWISFPTSDIYYGEKKNNLFMFRKVQAFCAALGEDLKATTLESVLKKVFAKPEKLAGKPLTIRVGYEKAYAKYAGKNPDGTPILNLRLADGTLHQDAGAVKTFTGADSRAAYDSVQRYANEHNIGYDAFAQVVEYLPGKEAPTDETPW